jgi:hypothetical protein
MRREINSISLEEIFRIEDSFEYDYCYKSIKALKASSYLISFLLDSLEWIAKAGYSYKELVEKELQEDWNLINWLQEDNDLLEMPIAGDYEGYPFIELLKKHVENYLMQYAYLFSDFVGKN